MVEDVVGAFLHYDEGDFAGSIGAHIEAVLVIVVLSVGVGGLERGAAIVHIVDGDGIPAGAGGGIERDNGAGIRLDGGYVRIAFRLIFVPFCTAEEPAVYVAAGHARESGEADGGERLVILPAHPGGVALGGVVLLRCGSRDISFNDVGVLIVIGLLSQLAALIVLHAVRTAEVDDAVDVIIGARGDVVDYVGAAAGRHIISAVHTVGLVGGHAVQDISAADYGHLKVYTVMVSAGGAVIEVAADSPVGAHGGFEIGVRRIVRTSLECDVVERICYKRAVHIDLDRNIGAVCVQLIYGHGRAGGKSGIGVVASGILGFVKQSGLAVGDIVGGIAVVLLRFADTGIHVHHYGEGDDQLIAAIRSLAALGGLCDRVFLIVEAGDTYAVAGNRDAHFVGNILSRAPGIGISGLSGDGDLLYGHAGRVLTGQAFGEIEVLRERIGQHRFAVRIGRKGVAGDRVGYGSKYILKAACGRGCEIVAAVYGAAKLNFIGAAPPAGSFVGHSRGVLGGDGIHVPVGLVDCITGVSAAEDADGIHRHACILQRLGGVDSFVGDSAFIRASACGLTVGEHNDDLLGFTLRAVENALGVLHTEVGPSGAGGGQIVYLSFQRLSAAAHAGQLLDYLRTVIMYILRVPPGSDIYFICIVSNVVGPITGELDDADLMVGAAAFRV